jgi:type IV pilus assembly protein PilA
MALRRGTATRARLRSAYQAARETDGGFSLIELLVVMIIIGILASIAIPIFLGQRQKSYDAQAKEDIHSAAIAEESYYVEQQNYLNVPTATATTLPALLTGSGFRMSSKTIDITVWTYPVGSTTGGSTTTQQNGSFCMKVTSGSNTPFYYASFGGGLTTTACT